MTSQRMIGRPQSWPSGEKASGGAPIVASRRNSRCRAQTSALFPETMKGTSPKSWTPAATAARRASSHCPASSHCTQARKRSAGVSARRRPRECARFAGPAAPPATRPRPLGSAARQGTEQHVVVEPPALGLDEALRRRGCATIRTTLRGPRSGRSASASASPLTRRTSRDRSPAPPRAVSSRRRAAAVRARLATRRGEVLDLVQRRGRAGRARTRSARVRAALVSPDLRDRAGVEAPCAPPSPARCTTARGRRAPPLPSPAGYAG